MCIKCNIWKPLITKLVGNKKKQFFLIWAPITRNIEGYTQLLNYLPGYENTGYGACRLSETDGPGMNTHCYTDYGEDHPWPSDVDKAELGCKEMCDNDEACLAFEYTHHGDSFDPECELWFCMPKFTKPNDDDEQYVCMIKGKFEQSYTLNKTRSQKNF